MRSLENNNSKNTEYFDTQLSAKFALQMSTAAATKITQIVAPNPISHKLVPN